jgi:hypothetical protein
LFSHYFDNVSLTLFCLSSICYGEVCSVMNQAMTSLMTTTSSAGTASDPSVSLPGFNRWLLRARPGDQLAYHRGHLVWDRSPASGLPEPRRHALARVADAALAAADRGLVHLAQRRFGPFDFMYLAIKATAGAQPAVASAMCQRPQPKAA